MREESTLEEQPEQRWFRRRCLWVGMLAGILAMGLLLFGFVNREPRYQGKTSVEWFPYLWDLSKGPMPGSALTNGALGSFPVLWSALQSEPPGWTILYFGILSPLQSWITLPAPVSTSFIHAEAARAILQSSVSPAFAELVSSRWRELPRDLRIELISDLSTESRFQALVPKIGENLKPLLTRLLADADPDLQTLAAYVLLRVPGLSVPDLQRLGRLGRGLPSGMIQTSHYRIRLGLYRGTGVEGRRVMAEALSEGQAIAEDRVQLPLCLLDPGRFPIDEYWESTEDLQRDWQRRRAVIELIDFALSTEGLEELAPWFGRLLVSDITSEAHPDQAADRTRSLDGERRRILDKVSGSPASHLWCLDGLAEGLSAPSQSVRRKSAYAIARLNASSPAVTQAAAAALLRHEDTRVMLRILTQARVMPTEVAPLVQSLAAGETTDGWVDVSPAVVEAARALLTAVAARK